MSRRGRARRGRAPDRRELWGTVLAVAAGGAVGAVARYGTSLWLPAGPTSFPWATFLTNVAGCLAIGALMVLLLEAVDRPYPLLRPFLAIGVLGGYTTFSTYAVETHQLLGAGAPATALVYAFGTVAAALTAVHVGTCGTRRVLRRRGRGRP